MKSEYQKAAGAIAVEAAVWLLTTGFLVIAALVTLARSFCSDRSFVPLLTHPTTVPAPRFDEAQN